MTQAEQILNQVKDRVAQKHGYDDWNNYENYGSTINLWPVVALEFGREMCELQKKECLNNVEYDMSENGAGWAAIDGVNEESILNAPNYCDK